MIGEKSDISSFISNPHYGKSYFVNLNYAHEELQDLIERVTIELELMNVARELYLILHHQCFGHSEKQSINFVIKLLSSSILLAKPNLASNPSAKGS